jgi:hypothetical protein
MNTQETEFACGKLTGTLESVYTVGEVKEAYQDALSQVLHFAAEVSPLFESNGWTWARAGKDRAQGVPDILDIQCTLETLLRACYKKAKEGEPSMDASTGRLQVRFTTFHAPVFRLELVPMHVTGYRKAS